MNTNTVSYIAARAKEASSWSGAAMMPLSAAHVSASPDLVSAGLSLVAAIGGVVAVLVPEKGASS